MSEDKGISIIFKPGSTEFRYDGRGEIIAKDFHRVIHITESGKLVWRDVVPQGPFPKDYVKT